MKTRKVKLIVENGILMTSKLIDIETGEPIRGMTSFKVEGDIDKGHDVKLTITLLDFDLEVDGRGVLVKKGE